MDVITDNLELWTSTVREKKASGRGSGGKRELYGVKKLRELILDLAIRGLLVEQSAIDGCAEDLVRESQIEKKKLFEDGEIKKQKEFPPISADEKRYAVPENWSWVRFSDIAISRLGKMLDKAKNKGEECVYLRNTNVQWHQFELDDLKTMKIPPEEQQEFILTKGDLLICEGGEPGRCAIWNEESTGPMYFQKALHRARTLAGNLPEFLQMCLTADARSGVLEEYFSGSTIKHLVGNKLNIYTIPLPPLAEQKRIVAKVDELMALCDQLEQQTEDQIATHETLVTTLLDALTSATNDAAQFQQAWQKLESNFDLLFTTESSIDHLKQAILQLAVMGKLVPQDPEDEPASELLKLINSEKETLIEKGKIKKQKELKLPPVNEQPYVPPEGWEWCSFGTCVTLKSGTAFPKEKELEKGKYPFCKVGDMNLVENTEELVTSTRFINPSENDVAQLIPKNSIAFPKRGGAIATNKKRYIFQSIFVDLNIMTVTPYSLVSLEWTRVWLDTIDLASLNSGTSVPQINNKDIDLLPFPLPPLNEQHRIVAKVSQILTLCGRLHNRLASAQATQITLTDSIVTSATQESKES